MDKFQSTTGDNPTIKSVVKIAYTVAVLMLMQVVCLFSIVSMQMAGIQGNIFQLMSLRFALQMFIGFLMTVSAGYSLKLRPCDIKFVLLTGLSNFIFTCTFNLAATFMPVGNSDGLFVSIYIISSTVFDVYKKRIAIRSVVVSGIAITGMILLVQPWNLNAKGENYSGVPCRDIELSLVQYDNETFVGNYTSHMSASKTVLSANAQLHRTIYGYILIIISSIFLTAEGNVIKHRLETCKAPVAIFWTSLFEGTACFLINLILTRFNNDVLYEIPTAKYCLLFYCTFLITASLMSVVSYVAYHLWDISSVAVSESFLSVMLYVSQRTVLKQFHPGHANMYEVVGILIIIVGVTLLPAILVVKSKICEGQKDTN